MADWGPWVGDSSGVPIGCSAVPSATAHVKGSFQYNVANTERCEGLEVHIDWEQYHSTVRTLLYDIGFDSSNILIANLMHCPPAAGASLSRAGQCRVYFPISVPAAQLQIRVQSSMASHGVVYPLLLKRRSGLPTVGSVVDTYGADTSNTKGVTVTAGNTGWEQGAWTEISASCKRIKALIVAVGHGQVTLNAHSDKAYTLQIGIGAAGSEQVVVDWSSSGGISSASLTTAPSFLGPVYVDIPEGSRLSARLSEQWNSSSQRSLSIIAYGIR